MLICGYEFYIRITFTKTAGALVAAGFLLFLYAIETMKTHCYAVGMFFVFMGVLYRSAILKIVLCVFFSAFIIYIWEMFKNKKTKSYMGIVAFIILVVSAYAIELGAEHLQRVAFTSDSVWDDYHEYNTARAILFDLGWPPYNGNEDAYEKIGVSYNDYVMWSQLANYTDTEEFTLEKINKISSISNTRAENKSCLQKFMDATRAVLKYLTGNMVCLLYFLCMLIIISASGKKSVWRYVPISGTCLFAYYYLYFYGRIQHHVDVVIFLCGIILAIYYCEAENFKIRRTLWLSTIVLLFIVNKFYGELTSSSYYGTSYGTIKSQKEQYNENYRKLSLLSNDSDNLYLMSAQETSILYPCFSVFQVIEKGFYHNIYRLNQYTIPVFRSPLEDYNVENPLEDIVNHQNIFYCASQECNNQIETITQYIGEHYDSEVESVLAKYVENMYIYRFISGDLEFDRNTISNDISEFHYDVNFVVNENNDVDIRGYAYLEGTDSYAQNMYVEITNGTEKNYQYYCVLQTENSELKNSDKTSGKYSAFSFNLSDKNIDVMQDTISLLVENEKGTYRIPISTQK